MEQSFLAYLRGRCRRLPQVAVGIGDDASILDVLPGHQQVACTDQIIDGVDFHCGEHAARDIGYKAMAINLSDIAAMGATPTAALVTLALPQADATRLAGDVYEGIIEAAAEFDVAIAGGDLSTYNGPLSISITLLGIVPSGTAWLRSGAREGDAILVTGPVGGSIMARHLRPRARVGLAAQLRRSVRVTAAIDISDGLSLDLDRLCAASGVGAELDIESIPIHADAIALAGQTGRSPFEHAWSDGEDFELIFTVDPQEVDQARELDQAVAHIGTITGRTGLWRRRSGKLERLSPQGYLH